MAELGLLDPLLGSCSTPGNEGIEAHETPPKLGASEHDFEWLSYMDLVYKRELVVALEDELREIGWMNETAETATSHNRRSPPDISATMKDLAKASRKDESHSRVMVDKKQKLMHELDFRLRNYHLALLRNRDVRMLKPHSGQLGGGTGKSEGSTSADNSNEPESSGSKSEAIAPEQTSKVNTHIKSHHIRKAPRDPSKPTWPMGIFHAFLTIAFILGGMMGLYFVTERPKRVGLIICLVCLFIIGLAVKRVRPEDMFLLAAAYAAVLVVFLSGDLGGPQEVIVNLIKSPDTNLVVPNATPVSPATFSNQESFTTSPPSDTPTTFLTVTPTAKTPISQDHAASSTEPSAPTSVPAPDTSSGFLSAGKIAGIVVGTIAGLLIVVTLGAYCLKRYI